MDVWGKRTGLVLVYRLVELEALLEQAVYCGCVLLRVADLAVDDAGRVD